MPEATAVPGMEAEYSIDWRDKDGNLIYREASLIEPVFPPAPERQCLNNIPQYKKAFAKWSEECEKILNFQQALREYHEVRCAYCQKHRHDKIDEKYRTGVPSPRTIEEAKAEIKKLRRLI